MLEALEGAKKEKKGGRGGGGGRGGCTKISSARRFVSSVFLSSFKSVRVQESTRRLPNKTQTSQRRRTFCSSSFSRSNRLRTRVICSSFARVSRFRSIKRVTPTAGSKGELVHVKDTANARENPTLIAAVAAEASLANHAAVLSIKKTCLVVTLTELQFCLNIFTSPPKTHGTSGR